MEPDWDLDCALHSRSRTAKPNNGLGLFQITKRKLTSNSRRSQMNLFSSVIRLTNGVKLTLHHRHHVFHRRLFYFLSLAPKNLAIRNRIENMTNSCRPWWNMRQIYVLLSLVAHLMRCLVCHRLDLIIRFILLHNTTRPRPLHVLISLLAASFLFFNRHTWFHEGRNS